MNCAHFLANVNVLRLNETLDECFGGELSPMNHSSADYTSHSSITEFYGVIVDVILDDKINQIKRFEVFRIAIDESIDKAKHKSDSVYPME